MPHRSFRTPAAKATLPLLALLVAAFTAAAQPPRLEIRQWGAVAQLPREAPVDRFPQSLTARLWSDGYLRISEERGRAPASARVLGGLITRGVPHPERVEDGPTPHGGWYAVYVATLAVGTVPAGGAQRRHMAEVALVGWTIATSDSRFVKCFAYVPMMSRSNLTTDPRVREAVDVCRDLRRSENGPQ